MREANNRCYLMKFFPWRLLSHLSLLGVLAVVSSVFGAEAGAGNPANAAVAPAGPPSATSLLTPERQKELFDALDLNGPRMEKVKEAVAKGDYATADHAWADYLRKRTSVPWLFHERAADGSQVSVDYRHPQRNPDFKNQSADDAAGGKVIGGLVQVTYTWPDNNINWFYNATGSTPPYNNEWQWQLCRMMFWNDMASAYRATGDEKYALAWANQLRSFVGKAPVPSQLANYPNSAWRSIESGIRMQGSWPNAFFSFLPSPSISDEDLAIYTLSCLDHGRYLRAFPTHGNFVTMEMNGLYVDGSVFPEFKEAKEWRTFAANKLFAQQQVQFLPDGAQFELSTGYQNVAVDNVAGLARTAKMMGHVDELPAGYIPHMEKAYAYSLDLMSPDRSLPRFNDSWGLDIRKVMKQALEFFPDRTDFQWVASDGKTGAMPDSTSHASLWSGYIAMRSSWDHDANYGAFRVGPIGAGHCQQDKLDFVMWCYGTEVLFSSGGGSYEQSKWRAYATDTFSHNCVLVDSKPQRQQTKDPQKNVSTEPIDARWQTTPQYDFAAGVYNAGYGKQDDQIATQTRRILFVKPDLFVVADTMKPNDAAEHTYQARWQLMSKESRQDSTTNEVVTTAPGQPNLAVVPLSTQGLEVRSASGQEEPELLGWNVRKDKVPEYVPATTVLHTKKGTGVQQFLTLFIPLKAGDPEPIKKVEVKNETSALVTLADGRTLTITADPDAAGDIEVVETLSGGAPGRLVKSK